jgi:DNA replication protein DnaC
METTPQEKFLLSDEQYQNLKATKLKLNSDFYWRLSQQNAYELESNFVLDDEIKLAFEALSLYFGREKKFEEKGFGSLNKGLFLIGDVGVGKTLLIKAFSYSHYLNFIDQLIKFDFFKVVNANSISGDFQKNGIEGIEKYFLRDYCFDDLGTEQIPSVHMGNRKNIMQEIIEQRYDNREKLPFRSTFFTSNLSGNQIEELYGTRVRSRIREMCNWIVIPGEDRRK